MISLFNLFIDLLGICALLSLVVSAFVGSVGRFKSYPMDDIFKDVFTDIVFASGFVCFAFFMMLGLR